MPTLEQLRKMSPIRRLAYWATEREKVRSLKEQASEKPWTTDPILQSYRFCNVRRMDDKVSRWLMENWYGPFFDHPNMLAAVALARFVNKPESLVLLTEHLFTGKKGTPPWWDTIKALLRTVKKTGGTVFNGAYMVRGNSAVTKDKVVIVVDEYVKPMFEVHKTFPLVRRDSMQQTHKLLVHRYGFGSFMAGQVVADLRWAVKGEWKDRMTWAPMGPGSARGLARLVNPEDWKTTAKRHVTQPYVWLKRFQEHVLHVLPPLLPRELSNKLEGHDYQNCLCEFDKYERALWGEGKPKQKYPGGK